MPRTITKTVYTFKELLERVSDPKATGNMLQLRKNAVDKAKEWLRDGNTQDEWWEYTYETWKSALDQIGFTNAEIYFHGFWSQGDGACFTSDVDVERIVSFFTSNIEASKCIPGLDAPLFGHTEDFRSWIVNKINDKVTNLKYRYIKWLWDGGHLGVSVKRISQHYSHWATCCIDIDYHNPKRHTLALIESFRDDLERLRKDLSQAIYKDLEEEYTFLCSDEQLAELAETNDYTFTADGRREG